MTELKKIPDAARMLGVSRQWLDERRKTGGGPDFVQISERKIFYRVADLEKFMEARVMQSS